ncbi:PIG-L family deacetylase [Luteolibacter sp. GHJ8]|uniref:PIG-L family deacetylase n=1 Tax=Luteolibacter rhizosphaerae TaxID=2989719 RepID=A0ABT3G0I9_9BACT|nr:PIG-L deacetylase family protein [Luteolibacter rhizosphaerae]MCW1913354.1 PIG-L family deacetylase [Luteolibacter rhizosphaerae]
MWSKLTQRLTDPLFYRKRLLQLVRPLRRPRATRQTRLEHLLEKEGPVLALIAHPDDELFASGLLCELAARGHEVHIVCLTRGEGGDTGGGTREELGRIREAELRASAAVLGASRVDFLNHVDPLGKAHRTYAPAVSANDLARQIGTLLAERSPSLLITHGSGGEYWHPAHILIHRAVFRAAGGKIPVLTIHAWQDGHALPGLLNRDDPPDLKIDGSGYREQRLGAFRAHRSQQAYFATHGGGSLEGYIDLTNLEAYRYYPARGHQSVVT